MKCKFIKNINVIGLRNIRLIQFKEKYILIGSKMYLFKDDIVKYWIYTLSLDDNLEINLDKSYFINFNYKDYLNNIYIKNLITYQMYICYNILLVYI